MSDYTFNVGSYGDLASAITDADQATDGPGTYVITFTQAIVLGADMPALNLATGVIVTIDGVGYALNGDTAYRGLFVYAGTLTVQNLAIEDTLAEGGNCACGGDHASSGGGGGAGLGGGLFVADDTANGTAPGNATLDNVSLAGDAAEGGAGGGSDNGYPGGGGGLGGSGGSTEHAAGGRLARGAGGGGIGGVAGGGTYNGGTGGGAASAVGGVVVGIAGIGGFGGGGFLHAGGGGGLGTGGDASVRQGASLTIEGGSLGNGSVSADAGSGAAGSGAAFATGIFLQGTQTQTLSPAAGQTLTIADVIADQTGSGGPGSYAGVAGLLVDSAGTVDLAAANSFIGAITIDAGELLLGVAGAARSGIIAFGISDPPILTFTIANAPTNAIDGFAVGDTIDVTDLTTIASLGTPEAGNTLTVPYTSDGGGTLSRRPVPSPPYRGGELMRGRRNPPRIVSPASKSGRKPPRLSALLIISVGYSPRSSTARRIGGRAHAGMRDSSRAIGRRMGRGAVWRPQ